ncbi:hypothetical protein MF672_008055 [Actinomadura sp. ATCC 31491]|uniref:Transaldolase n=1 Tax=Actinomadura luzonensis TaxID=2805427 RepID=A0ABT0FN25_9ACTN|nr:transaldolase family protein [Actinomadura luzonensis]MCK2213739.1 hypothetical protein [Actinomadura luzonensis]
MKLFLDSADPAEIEQALERGLIEGVTTNPSVLRAATGTSSMTQLKKIARLLGDHPPHLPFSVQVMADSPEETVRQALSVADELAYKSLVIKVSCGWEALRAVHRLARDGFQVNVTACMTTAQGLLAAAAGARYVSFFAGKMSDAGMDPRTVVAQSVPLLEKHGVEVILGSLRRSYDVTELALAGAHVVTVPWRFLRPLAEHPKTAEAIDLFAADFQPLVAGQPG